MIRRMLLFFPPLFFEIYFPNAHVHYELHLVWMFGVWTDRTHIFLSHKLEFLFMEIYNAVQVNEQIGRWKNEEKKKQ